MEMEAAIRALSALAQETRLAVFRRLVQAGFGGLPVNKIAEAVGVAGPWCRWCLPPQGEALNAARLSGCSSISW